MPSRPPRLGPTIGLALAWLALYLLYLSVKPEPARPRPASTTTTVTTGNALGELIRPAAVPAPGRPQAG